MFTRPLKSTYLYFRLQQLYVTWINASISRLIGYWLPMYRRQQRLDKKTIALHRALLHSIATTGNLPSASTLQELCQPKEFQWYQQQLETSDLLTQDDQGTITGLYPLSLTPTPYQVVMNDNHLHAICAIDALAFSPMFNACAVVQACCHISKESFHFSQQQLGVVETHADLPIFVGVRWQDPKASARQSICNDMVYLLGEDNAKQWQAQDPKSSTLFSLEEAIEFSALLFTPLISNTKLSELPFRTAWFTKVSFTALRVLWNMLFSSKTSDSCSSCATAKQTQFSSLPNQHTSHFSNRPQNKNPSSLDNHSLDHKL